MADQGSYGKTGALYVCVPHIRDTEQTPVDEQERHGRSHAVASGILVPDRLVFVDPLRSVWKPERSAPGWQALLAALDGDQAAAVLIHRPEWHVRHRPAQFTALLERCQDGGIDIRGFGDETDLTNPHQRAHLLRQAYTNSAAAAETGHVACDAHASAAAAGRPHGGGRRAFGYSLGMRVLIPGEADVVREIFRRYLAGATLDALASDLNRRRVPTSADGTWTASRVARIIDAPRYAGVRVFHGSVEDDGGGYRRGDWDACVSIEMWEQAQRERRARAVAAATDHRERREYPLTGLVLCAGCVQHMTGSAVAGYRMYVCPNDPSSSAHCARAIGADSLERHVNDLVSDLLENWEPWRHHGPDAPVTARKISGMSVPGPDTFRARHGSVAVRTVSALDGIETGAAARQAFGRLPSARRSAVYRFFLAAVHVGLKTTSRGVFDDSRIRPIWHPFTTAGPITKP